MAAKNYEPKKENALIENETDVGYMPLNITNCILARQAPVGSASITLLTTS